MHSCMRLINISYVFLRFNHYFVFGSGGIVPVAISQTIVSITVGNTVISPIVVVAAKEQQGRTLPERFLLYVY